MKKTLRKIKGETEYSIIAGDFNKPFPIMKRKARH